MSSIIRNMLEEDKDCVNGILIRMSFLLILKRLSNFLFQNN